MPIRTVIHLPGPYVWTSRVHGHRSFRHTLWYWLFGIWMLELTARGLVIVLFAVTWLLWQVCKLLLAGALIILGSGIRYLTHRPRTVGRHRIVKG
jgi:hypothetical protein